VRRWFGTGAGLLAGALLALTPVAVLMFRFNNPDAAMTLLLVAAAYCVTRAVDSASLRWLLGCGAVMGLSFLAKGLQPFTVLPALALVYLVAAPTTLRRRFTHLLLAGVALVVGAGWWVLAVQLTPAGDRPYIGGSGNNTALGLAFGYNGVSRLTGGSGAGGGAGGGFDGTTGIGRLFNSLNGGQIAWLLPAALVGLLALGVLSARAVRADRTRAAALLWGGWLLVTGAVLSFAGGIIHTYYTVELAPAIAALVATATVTLWRRRVLFGARVGLAVGVVLTGYESWMLLHRSTGWHPWIAWLVLVGSGAAAVGVLLPVARRALAAVVVVAGLVALTGGSAAYALSTAATAHTGSTPSAGPAVSGSDGFGGGFGHGGLPPAGGLPGRSPGASSSGSSSSGSSSGGFPGGGFPGPSSSGSSSGGFPGGGFPGSSSSGSSSGGFPGGSTGGPGGDAQSVSSALTTALKDTTTRWAAATVGSQSAGPLELASGKAVMAIGGFSGSDASPTLTQFESYVKAGEIRYYIAGGFGGGRGGAGGGTGSAITSWVQSHYASTTVGGQTVYDLSKPKSS
jgi:4-amino-4-deoxy-L-arabinose transferase-like glycosyltransferase